MFKYLCLLFMVGCAVEIPTLDDVVLKPNNTIETTPADYGYAYTETTLNVSEDRSIVVWHVPSEESKALLVIIPGSDANKGLYTQGIPIYNPYGYDLLLLDYEGYGNSPGVPSLTATVDDAITAVNYALSLHDKVFVYGVSLGSPLATYVGSQCDLKGIVLEGSFIIHQEAELWLNQNNLGFGGLWHAANFWMYPQIPEQYDILKCIQQVSEPKLIMHSTEDTITPYDGGILVFNAAPEPKEFWQMRGDHGKMVQLDTESYIDKVIGWLDRQLGE